MRRPLLLLAIVSALAAVSAPAGAAPTAASPVVVGTDPVGDWGGGGDIALIGHALGQDLLSASISMPDPDSVHFTFEVSFLPSTGGVPELSRYTWSLLVDNTPGVTNPDGSSDAKYVELDGKFTNYSRGACDPTSGQCPPPRDPGERPFFVRGDCAVNPDTNITLCRELGTVRATFDPLSRTITIPVTRELLSSASGGTFTECSVILPGPNLFGGSVSAAPSAFFTSSAMPLDTMELTEAFQVPTDDVDNPCPEPVLE